MSGRHATTKKRKPSSTREGEAGQEPVLKSTGDLRAIKDRERERFARIARGDLPLGIFRKPCRVKILMLVDTGISYNQFYFGLSEVLDTLRENPEWWVNFEVTRAHRQNDPNPPANGTPAYDLYGPHFENFRFDQSGFDLDDYDQVWFFGFNRGNTGALTDDELEILFRWMDNGGGVFATGDHANLGEALCSNIPRVRSMRKWRTAGVDPAPFAFGPDRHDTLRKGHDFPGTAAVDESTSYTFDDESDDVPMVIRLRWYVHHHCHGGHLHHHHLHWYWPYFTRRSPHPVLCGMDGPIRILPDHPHEGEVVVPRDLTEIASFGDYSAPEYPEVSGQPLSPEIIAWAKVQDDHSNESFKGACNAKEFGAIGAYNGHCAGVGRVIVDSTWHHWFDVNLTGRMVFSSSTPGNVETGDLRKLEGFNSSPQGQQALSRIRNYYRNVAIWLSPRNRLRCMAARGLWNALRRYPLFADLSLDQPIWVKGHHAIDVLGKYAGQCQVYSWWPLLYPKLDINRLMDPEVFPVPIDPLKMMDAFILGGILHAMIEIRDSGKADRKAPNDKTLLKTAETGARAGVEALLEHIGQSQKAHKVLADILKKGVK